MLDLTALKNEIQTDPLGLGYNAYLAAGNDLGIAALLNATTGPGAATIGLPVITKGDFLAAILPALVVLPTKDAATQQKWDRVLAVVEEESKRRLVLGLLRGTIRNKPELADTVLAELAREEDRLITDLAPPDDDDRREGLRHAVLPLLAAVITSA